ncbi:MAG: hypothetical protein H7210_01430 [Pyrinomonadaceae bacterium]|nr:hypothetical protein [Phycisphaerales bacterium]
MRRDRIIQLGAVGAMLGCMVASGMLTASISGSAGRNRLVYADSAEDGDPPQVALGIAMGAFRGIFVNILWMRANDRKNDGRYYDAVDLARTITKLQPRFPRVWAFHAWNLAYNISVTTNTPQERWDWVNQGIRLLRDEGIPANPNDLLLHKELAWIYLHKIQGYMDDSNPVYKRAFAAEWTYVLGTPPTRTAQEFSTPARLAQLKDWLQPVQDVPFSLKEVEESKVPGADKVAEFVSRLKTAGAIDVTGKLYDDRGAGPGERLLALVETAKRLSKYPEALRRRVEFQEKAAEATIDLMSEPEMIDARNLVIANVRKRILDEKYHMSVYQMIFCMDQYGPMDWRHPAAHALYWSSKGTNEALSRINEVNRRDFDFINADRQTLHAIQELFRTGEILFDPMNEKQYLTLPSADFIPAYGNVLEFLRARADVYEPNGKKKVNVEDTGRRIYTSYSAGYENFLKDAVRFLYRRGDMAEAQKYFEKVRDYNKMNTNDPNRTGIFDATLAEFVENEIVKDDRFGVPDVAKTEIIGALQSAYVSGLLNGDMKQFRSSMDYAKMFHAVFVQKQINNVVVNQGDQGRMEVVPRHFEIAAGQILAGMIDVLRFPDGPTLYARAPADLQAWSYYFLNQTSFKQELGGDFETYFPASSEWPAFRARMAQMAEERGKDQGTLEEK